MVVTIGNDLKWVFIISYTHHLKQITASKTKSNGLLHPIGIQTKQFNTSMTHFQAPKSLGFYRLKGVNLSNHRSLARHETWDQGHFYYKQIQLINNRYNKHAKVSTLWSSVCLILFVLFGIAVSNYTVKQNQNLLFNESLHQK